MAIKLPQPDRDRLSTLTALILLAYGLVRIITLPAISAEFTVLGLVIRLELNTQTVLLTLSAGLAVAGTEWLLRTHPSIDLRKRTLEHWILPGLAALGIGALIVRLPSGPALGLGVLLAAGLLISVPVAEFIVVFAADPRRDAAAIGLRILAYLLLVESFFAIKAVSLRAFFAVPLTFLAAGAVSWRLLRLGRVRSRAWIYAILVGWATAQISWGLHYWPLDPLVVALLLGLFAYLANGLLLSYVQGEFEPVRAAEYGLVGLIALVAILLLT